MLGALLSLTLQPHPDSLELLENPRDSHILFMNPYLLSYFCELCSNKTVDS